LSKINFNRRTGSLNIIETRFQRTALQPLPLNGFRESLLNYGIALAFRRAHCLRCLALTGRRMPAARRLVSGLACQRFLRYRFAGR
jgi:hypothetical protein